MMRGSRGFWAAVLGAGVLAACASPVAQPGVGAATPGPVATGTPMPTPMPSAAGTPTPAPAPTASATPSPRPLALSGRLVREYDFKNPQALALDPFQGQIHVVDVTGPSRAASRFGMYRFTRDGRFLASVELHQASEPPPDAVPGYVINQVGVPHFLYQYDEELTLRRLVTATVQDVEDYPSHRFERAGLGALRADGEVLTMAVLGLDPDEKVSKRTDTREIFLLKAEPGETPEAIVRVADPFVPVAALAPAPDTTLFAAGLLPGGRPALQRLTAEGTWSELPGTIESLPDRMVVSPAGAVWCFNFSTGSTGAPWRSLGATGQIRGTGTLLLADGTRVLRPLGVAFEGEQKLIVVGNALDAAGRDFMGLFEFEAVTE